MWEFREERKLFMKKVNATSKLWKTSLFTSRLGILEILEEKKENYEVIS